MLTPPKSVSRGAFTLLELLVVISIIAVLAGLLLPVTGAVMENSRKTQTKSTELQIITAIKGYQTDYGVYPVPANTTTDFVFGEAGMTTAQLTDVLRANGKSVSNDLNPRQTVYLEMPPTKNQTSGQGKNGIDVDGWPRDPWGNIYFVVVDSNYDNGVTNPYASGAGFTTLNTGVIVLTRGKDGQSTFNFGGGGGDKNTGYAKDDVISWQ